MNTEEIAGLVASVSIAKCLLLHTYNFGIPKVWEVSSYREGAGLRNVATLAGVGTIATVSGIVSEDLKGTIDALPKPYDRMITRSAVAGSFIATKTIVQAGVVLAYSMFIPDGKAVMSDYVVRQLAPSLVLDSIAATVIPYALSN